MLSYSVRLKKDDNDSYLVTCRDFPEIVTFGETRSDAMANAAGAIEEAIAARLADREDIPTPSKGRNRVPLSTRVALKLALHFEMRRQGTSKAALARKLKLHRPQVDRLLDIRHHSNLDSIDAALLALGKRAAVEIRECRPVSDEAATPSRGT